MRALVLGFHKFPEGQVHCTVLYCTVLHCTVQVVVDTAVLLERDRDNFIHLLDLWAAQVTRACTQPEQSPMIISRLRLTAWASSASQRTMSSCGPCSTAAASNISYRCPICRTLFAPVADTPPSWTCLGGGGTRPSPRTRWWPPSRCPSPSPPPPSCSPSWSSPAGTASSSNSAERTSSAGRRLSSSTNNIYCCLLHINCLQLNINVANK